MKKRIAQFQRLADHAVIEPDGRFYVFGQDMHDAVVVVGTYRNKDDRSKFLKLNSSAKSLTVDKKRELISSVKRFANLDAREHLGSFSILANGQRTLRDAIQATKASHLEFNCEETLAKAFAFNVSSQNGNVLWKSGFVSTAEGIELHNARGNTHSSFVMKSQTFLKMPSEPYSVSLYEDYAIFSSSKDDTVIYIHDQEIRRPYAVFLSDRLGTPTIFLFHPKS